jgi:ribonuclease HII
MAATPSLRFERQIWRAGAGPVAAVDEVGRGALAGPVSVGVAVLDERARTAPQGLRDSKLLTPEARVALLPAVRRWVLDYAVGHASAAEIDAWGILTALRVAAVRAFEALQVRPAWVLLDGNYDYLNRLCLLEEDAPAWRWDLPVRTLVKADMRCSTVAAASVLAKTERDGLMERLALLHPAYGWEQNRGYSTPGHIDALSRLGPSPLHRRSWRLPGVAGADGLGPLGGLDELDGRDALEELAGRDERDGLDEFEVLDGLDPDELRVRPLLPLPRPHRREPQGSLVDPFEQQEPA